jgi:hypothetical protein
MASSQPPGEPSSEAPFYGLRGGNKPIHQAGTAHDDHDEPPPVTASRTASLFWGGESPIGN